jgi:hypothetical protein
MPFIKGNDGKAKTILNPLEGSIGDVALDEINTRTLTASGNVTVGNVVFPNGSKLGSASWTLLDSLGANFAGSATQMVTMSNTPATLKSNYNELYIRLQGPNQSLSHTSTIIPTPDIVANSTVSLGTLPSQNTGDSQIIWAGLGNASIRILQSTNIGGTGNIVIYGR